MIYHPDDILNFGTNEGYSLAEVYYYLPSYIEFLIKYIQDFEINVDEFYSLGKSLKELTETKPIKNPKSILDYGRIANVSHKGSAKKIADLPASKKVEFNYEFPKEHLEILELKKKGEYIAPPYNYYSSLTSKLNIAGFIKKKN